jgi:hypothetical protein
MNDLAEIIKQADADVEEQEALVASADARAAAAQADAAAAREKLAEARIVLEWLRRRGHAQPVAAPMGEHNGHAQSEPPMRFGRPVPEEPLTDKCQEVLEALGGTATNKQITDRLIRDGLDVDLDKVRGTLKYLSRKKMPPVTTEKGSGLWRLVRTMNGAAGGER